MDNEFKLKNGSGHLCCRGCGRQDNKLNTYDWLADVPGNAEEQDMVEVQFKNTRKGYYKNSNHIPLEKGDVVAVEASPGHDIGTVTLTGRLVPLQIKKANLKPDAEIKRIYRKAKPVDLEKYEEAKSREHATMIRSRKIAEDLGLQMKIGDVEYQGDGNKAIFYYIADERVDFRQLIKVLAEAFRVRIEMKQIGARQEAGRIGGIGPCGRELCCATWMKNFVSVSTSAARFQDISLNPQKLAGQCAKLKCCLNYEVDAYVECQKRLPSKEITLETADSTYYFFKADILSGMITYSTDKSFLANEATISARRAFEVLNMNKRGEKPEKLVGDNVVEDKPSSRDLVEQESLTRFDKTKKKKKSKKEAQGGKTANDRGRSSRNRSDERGDNRRARGENGGSRNDNGEARNENNGSRNENNGSRNENRDVRGEGRNGRQNREQRENREPRENRNNQNGAENVENHTANERQNEPRDGEQRNERRNRQRDNRPNRNKRGNGQNNELNNNQPNSQGNSQPNNQGNNQPDNQISNQEAAQNGNATTDNRGEKRPYKEQRPRGERRPRQERREGQPRSANAEAQETKPAENREAKGATKPNEAPKTE